MRSGTAASTSRSGSPTESAPPAISPIKARRSCAGHCSRPPNALPGALHPTTPTTSRSQNGSTTTAPVSRPRANSAGAPTTSYVSSATTRSPRATRRRSRSSSMLPPNHSLCACPSSDRCLAASSRNAPAANARRRWPTSIDRAAATLRGLHPINHLVAGHDPRT